MNEPERIGEILPDVMRDIRRRMKFYQGRKRQTECQVSCKSFIGGQADSEILLFKPSHREGVLDAVAGYLKNKLRKKGRQSSLGGF